MTGLTRFENAAHVLNELIAGEQIEHIALSKTYNSLREM